MDNMNRLFRKAKFGGFNKEDVMQYIETMKTDFFDYKAQVEETIRELNEKLAVLEKTDAPKAEPPAESSEDGAALSINEATEHLKQVADELCDKMNRLIGRIQGEAPNETDAEAEAEPEQMPEEVTEPEPEPEPEQPETPQDKVQALLDGLFSKPCDDAPAQPEAPKSFDLSDVFPAYTK